MLMCYSECIVRPEVHWKLNYPPSLYPVGSKENLSCPMSLSFSLRLHPAPFPPVSERPRLWQEEHQTLLLILTSLVGNSCGFICKKR